eukprot:CAMPEP_0203681286 /NCGR_PEP_ID=MMETSP0090-20130426/42258_1 /ASSEMBLY_ACC=CAM_ASM_001088 /TAXON_ID=426623 /ORGANISM="Chaetoceros affinis, Strain CCMP159" /LENGTH=480 /DNA_ID=CAMNT_0050549713 /DNA_START=64 /DNA_END=1506 /DNA_ORIENTATION=+
MLAVLSLPMCFLFQVICIRAVASEREYNEICPESAFSTAEAAALPSPSSYHYKTFEQILAQDYDALDPILPPTVTELKRRGAHRHWHKHSTFLDHLLGVHNILRLWDQSHIVSRVGLLHSAYSNSYVNLALFDPMDEDERSDMRLLIGELAEEIVHLFCTIDRQHIVVDTILVDEGSIVDGGGIVVPHLRGGGEEDIFLSQNMMILLVVFTMADVADQYFGWQDRLFGGAGEKHSMLFPLHASDIENNDGGLRHHESTALWPGMSKPGLWMSYVSELGMIMRKTLESRVRYKNGSNNNDDNSHGEHSDNDIYSHSDSKRSSKKNSTKNGNGERSVLENHEFKIPPIFDNCTRVLLRDDEAKARDLYWSVIMEEDQHLSSQTQTDQAIQILQEASKLNPWFFECHVLLAQKYLHMNDNEKAMYAAEQALNLQMIWGTAYDKRMSFDAWVAWTRVLYERARDGLGWPSNSWEVNNFGMVNSE